MALSRWRGRASVGGKLRSTLAGADFVPQRGDKTLGGREPGKIVPRETRRGSLPWWPSKMSGAAGGELGEQSRQGVAVILIGAIQEGWASCPRLRRATAAIEGRGRVRRSLMEAGIGEVPDLFLSSME